MELDRVLLPENLEKILEIYIAAVAVGLPKLFSEQEQPLVAMAVAQKVESQPLTILAAVVAEMAATAAQASL